MRRAGLTISRAPNVYAFGMLRRLAREARLRPAESFLARLFIDPSPAIRMSAAEGARHVHPMSGSNRNRSGVLPRVPASSPDDGACLRAERARE